MKKYLLGIVLALTAAGAMAVDGYKSVKFGSSIQDVKKANLCSLETSPLKSKIAGLSIYMCFDFKFSGKNTIASFAFLNDKFQRLAINIDSNVTPVFDALAEKYGEPSFMSSRDDIIRAMQTGEPVFFKFDKNTIIIQVEKVNGVEVTSLIYLSPDYEDILNSMQKNNISGDI